jgi:ssDNA-binding Zn-finger/Zn-ribbon topoisomerase 1
MQKANAKEPLALKDLDIQEILNKFLSGEIKTLDPVYDQQTGYRYPAVEAIVGNGAQVEAFLNKLHREGVIEKKLYDKTVSCPNCGSADVSFRYCCPFCKSFDIQKSSLIEHVKCGYMDVEAHFRDGDKHVCPKCHTELKKIDVDYRKAGVWCACNECKKNFDIPVPEHFCRNCNTVSTFEGAIIKDVYSYTVKENMREAASLNAFLIAPIRALLVEEGLIVESPAFLKGKSGTNHSFDIVAYEGKARQKAIVLDLAKSTGEIVSEQPVIALFAKIFDVSPDKAYLIAIPQLNENGRKMAQLYNIQTIEAKSQKEAVKALKEKLR